MIKKNSPKNKYRASIRFSKALEIGSTVTARGMTLNEVRSNVEFYTQQATQSNTTSLIVIYINNKTYPDFDWQEVERYNV